MEHTWTIHGPKFFFFWIFTDLNVSSKNKHFFGHVCSMYGPGMFHVCFLNFFFCLLQHQIQQKFKFFLQIRNLRGNSYRGIVFIFFLLKIYFFCEKISWTLHKRIFEQILYMEHTGTIPDHTGPYRASIFKSVMKK